MKPLEKGTIVKLKTFLGKTIAPKRTVSWDNYWKLIGEKGKVIDKLNDNGRVLILFERNLDDFKVANHNPIHNSLWIKPTDLELENAQ